MLRPAVFSNERLCYKSIGQSIPYSPFHVVRLWYSRSPLAIQRRTVRMPAYMLKAVMVA